MGLAFGMELKLEWNGNYGMELKSAEWEFSGGLALDSNSIPIPLFPFHLDFNSIPYWN